MSQELVIERALALLAASERHIDAHLDGCVDRDDLAGARLLLEALHKILEEGQRLVIADQRELLGECGPSEDAVKLMMRHVRQVGRTYTFHAGLALRYVTNPHGRKFDPMATAFSRLARELEPDTELIFRGSEHLGYALSPPLLTRLVDTLKSSGSDLAERIESLPTIVYVQYPALAEDDVLQHLLIAHEVAHLVMRRQVKQTTEHEQRFERGVRAAGVKIRLGEVDKTKRARALSWFTEIACDIIAMRLVGPGYYLALCEHALAREWFYRQYEEGLETHPHLAWRLTRAKAELDRFLTEMEPGPRGVVEALLDPYRLAVENPDARIAGEGEFGKAIQQALDELVNDLDEGMLIGGAGLDPGELAGALPTVMDQLSKNLAPVEQIKWGHDEVLSWREGDDLPPWSEPLDWRVILNGGYLHLLSTVEPPSRPLRGAWREVDVERRQLIEHLRGTVELSEFQRAAADVDKLRDLEARAVAA